MDKLGSDPRVRVRWTSQLEKILIGWADKAIVYKWFHYRSAKKYKKLNYGFTIPCVLLSSILASASFSITGEGGLIPDQWKEIAQYIIGGVNIIIGALQTLQNFFKFAQNCEAHDSVGKQWFKFYRMINTELSIERNKRKDADDFLKYSRLEYDRLIELSPTIPGYIIEQFKKEFAHVKDLELPDICNVIEHTVSFKHDDIEEPSENDNSNISHILSKLDRNIFGRGNLLTYNENNTDGNQDYSNNLTLPDFVTSSNNHNALLQINSNIASDNNTIVNSHIINLNI